MLTFAYYLLKVIIYSGILYGYYYIALRNKMFHRWNRFYLLAVVVLSLIAPLIKINIWQKPEAESTQVVQLLQVVNTSDEIVFNYTKHTDKFSIDATTISAFIYIIIAAFFFAVLVYSVAKIQALLYKNKVTVVDGIKFINTDAKGTPFSFFNYVFWNNKIDIMTPAGKQIFKHELAHVKEKHSYDKIFLNITLIFCWCNPFFWMIRKELNQIHEFIADKKAVEDSDTSAFAAMILQATYPQHQFNITNNFFYSPIKRRLFMLTKNNNPKVNYVSRLLVLPLAVILFFAFTVRMKKVDDANIHTGKKITVVIDAGHGGTDFGATGENGIKEKDITLAIAKKIKQLNNNENLNIVLSREEDKMMTPKQRVEFTSSIKADLFISIHVDAETNKNEHNGFSIIIPPDGNINSKESKLLGSDINTSFKNNYQLPVANDLMQRVAGILVLKANSCPAVLLEVGYITSQNDLLYLLKPENKEIIAKNILSGIENYIQQSQSYKTVIHDTTRNEVKVYLKKKTEEAESDETKDRSKQNLAELNKNMSGVSGTNQLNMDASNKSKDQEITFHNISKAPQPLYIIDGKEVSHIDDTNPSNIERIDVLKGEAAIKKYGDKGKDGVIEITTKKEITIKDVQLNKIAPDTLNVQNGMITKDVTLSRIETNLTPVKEDKVFIRVEIEPSFPGGQQAWTRYITKVIQNNLNELTDDNRSGTCRVRFIVNTDGGISEVEAITMKGSVLARVAVDAIKKGPKWVPAQQNGHIVASYKEQPLTFTIQNDIKSLRTIDSGDKIFVSLSGKSEMETLYIVAKDGTIFPQGLGKIIVKGLAFETAKNLITEQFKKVVPPKTSIDVSIVEHLNDNIPFIQ